jgi:glutamyl-tRNA synthetase
VEDTDQSREVEGALAQFDRAFSYFDLAPDEADDRGDYGPYHQSQREQIYLTYVRELLRQGRAYPCFATKEELAEITARQQAAKLPTGYYGRWALWRDAQPSDVAAKLADGVPYVVRFRAPELSGDGRVSFVDAIRGKLSHEANRNDTVILKASDQSPRLPTYHFAHAVDDHLMRVTLVIRSEEWISSVPLHQQLFAALGHPPITYAHIAPLMKQIPGGKRKLSKRKDPRGERRLLHRRGLPGPRGAVLPARAGQRAAGRAAAGRGARHADPARPVRHGGPARRPGQAGGHQRRPHRDAARCRGARRRHGVGADLRPRAGRGAGHRAGAGAAGHRRRTGGRGQPAQGPAQVVGLPRRLRLLLPRAVHAALRAVGRAGGDGDRPAVVAAYIGDLIDSYQHLDDPKEWFDQIRAASTRNGFAASPKEYKADPDAYHGSIREASQLVRVALTGSTRSPDMHAIAKALGPDEVLARLRVLA